MCSREIIARAIDIDYTPKADVDTLGADIEAVRTMQRVESKSFFHRYSLELAVRCFVACSSKGRGY